MLVVLTTDAVADTDELDAALRAATRVSFDRLDSDGAMSTNDTVLLLASGASGVTPRPDVLRAAVTRACTQLAAALLADAEGATKEIAIEVAHAASEDDAVQVGRSVARNNLVKTAFFGGDANWGRILAAVGTTDRGLRPRPHRRGHQRGVDLPGRRHRRRPVRGRPVRPGGARRHRPACRVGDRDRSAPTTCRTPTCTRTRRTRHDRGTGESTGTGSRARTSRAGRST